MQISDFGGPEDILAEANENAEPKIDLEIPIEEIYKLPIEIQHAYLSAFREGYILKAAQYQQLEKTFKQILKRESDEMAKFAQYRTDAKNHIAFMMDTLLHAYKTVLYMKPLEDNIS